MTDPLHTVLAKPELDDPIAVIHLEGWIDAGGAATVAASRLRSVLTDEVTIASFDTDVLLDHRAHRPLLHLVDGVSNGFTWPRVELIAGHIGGTDVMLLTGSEPDHLWQRFSTEVVALLEQFGVHSLVGLGAYPAATPHTRPVRLSATATTPALAEGYLNATLDVPAGVQAVIEEKAGANGIEALGIWAQVPHYAATSVYPAAAAELLRQVGRIGDVRIDTSELDADALRLRAGLDERLQANSEHAQLLAELERDFDSFSHLEDSSGDDLARELEDFLRTQDDDEH